MLDEQESRYQILKAAILASFDVCAQLFQRKWYILFPLSSHVHANSMNVKKEKKRKMRTDIKIVFELI